MTFFPNSSDFLGRDIFGAQVDAVGSDGQGDVSAGVDEEGGSQLAVLSSQLGDNAHRLRRQGFQVARGEIFFPELDVVDAGAGGLGDFFQYVAMTRGFVGGEG